MTLDLQTEGMRLDQQIDNANTKDYKVLARKYRPALFADLIGQEALVRTLSNAIRTNRIAHAFLLTGIRGVGKTTTARIIARALNCTDESKVKGETVEPCGRCDNCIAIKNDRHPDVIEMDAASRTGVGDIREIIESVKYLPNTAEYKIYIIDEVHMLSNSAFNALLKTLEEPPKHVKFIFATTEIRKIPVTIISRCQRFDLKRIGFEQLSSHLKNICEKEGAAIEEPALQLITKAAEGSVRDSLSLLDQAISYMDAGQPISESIVRNMLGTNDKTVLFDLFEKTLGNQLPEALKQLSQMYDNGHDPVMILQDLLEITN
ncbi:MAG: DNA polymerase III subunit gamma/tau, partial [Rickettsiales bacterium]|nr:DNA polymerase III subunit gamma/tau [Rickettsiales bacterium]